MDQQPPPTALLVANAFHFVAVVTRLMQMGWKVPQEISVVSRDDDPFLSFILPTPARYLASPHTMAKTLLRPVLELLDGGVVTHRSIRIMPDFIKGDSLGPPK
jgi:DNA-binding LacI/PurR family transcriptional regulator